jgi:MFS superfamily sulfate permease-like transporter
MKQNTYTPTDFLKEMIIGSVNTLICIPVLFGFATIVYSHPFFEHFRPVLVKVLLWSSIIHQVSMTLVSSMNFSVCQVQDAGLLFLGAIATKITDSVLTTCGPHDVSSTAIGSHFSHSSTPVSYTLECTTQVLSTTLFSITLATSLLGLALMFISYKKFATLVNYLPLSVIAAYLAYIGTLLFTAGISITTDFSLAVPHDIFSFFYHHSDFIFSLLPSWLLALTLMWVQRRFPSPLTLPLSLLLIPIVFYTVFFSLGYNLQHLRQLKLISEPQDVNTSVIEYLKPHAISFSLIPTVFVEWCLMVFVVAFSSALDIISIELELGTPLDINRELWSVGFSNLINGLFGGATGSYIFSQTIFTAKSKPKSRLPGAVLASIEAIVLLLSLDLTAYLPKLWFATTLTYIGFELMNEWILERRHKVQSEDYIITAVTFAAIVFISLQTGLFIGVLCSLIHFIYIYGINFTIDQFSFFHTHVDTIPPIVRPFIYPSDPSLLLTTVGSISDGYHNQSAKNNSKPLQLHQYLMRNVMILELNGHIRFMTAPKVLDRVREVIDGFRANELRDYILKFYEYQANIDPNGNNTNPVGSYDQLLDGDGDYDPFDGSFYTKIRNINTVEKNNEQNNEKNEIGDEIDRNNSNPVPNSELIACKSANSAHITSQTPPFTTINTNNNNSSIFFTNRDSIYQAQQLLLNENKSNEKFNDKGNLSQENMKNMKNMKNFQNNTNSYNTFSSSHPPTTLTSPIPSVHSSPLPTSSRQTLSKYINPTLIIDFSNIVGSDSSAIHTTRLILNSCNQLLSYEPNIPDLYKILVKNEPQFPFELPQHLNNDVNKIENKINFENDEQDDQNNDGKVESSFPKIVVTTTTKTSTMKSPVNNIAQYSSPLYNNDGFAITPQNDHNDPKNNSEINSPKKINKQFLSNFEQNLPLLSFTTTFDVIFTGIDPQLLQLFNSNRIQFFDTTNSNIGIEKRSQNVENLAEKYQNFQNSEQFDNNSKTHSEVSNNNSNPISTSNNSDTSLPLSLSHPDELSFSRTGSSASITSVFSNISTTVQNMTKIPPITPTSYPSIGALAQINTNNHNHYYQGDDYQINVIGSSQTKHENTLPSSQLEICTMFSLDPHFTPSFVSPYYYHCYLRDSGFTIPPSRTQEGQYDEKNEQKSAQIKAVIDPTPEQAVTFAHFSDLPNAKAWVAAKAYFLFNFE